MMLLLESRRAKFAAVLLAAAFANIAAHAQSSAPPKLKGAYVFTEEGLTRAGQPAATLALLNFAENGSVVGTAVTQTGAGAITFDLQGAYAFDADNLGTMALNASIANPDNETVQTAAAGYRLIFRAGGQVSLVRSDPWFYSSGEMIPFAGPGAKGTYFLKESSNRPLARVAMITFDGNGTAGGQQIASQMGVSTRLKLTGTVTTQPSGFQSLALVVSGSEPDESGEVQSSRENYLFLATDKDIRMIRTDSGAGGILTLIR